LFRILHSYYVLQLRMVSFPYTTATRYEQVA